MLLDGRSGQLLMDGFADIRIASQKSARRTRSRCPARATGQRGRARVWRCPHLCLIQRYLCPCHRLVRQGDDLSRDR